VIYYPQSRAIETCGGIEMRSRAMSKIKTTAVKAWGTTTTAFAERNSDGSIVVRVYDSVAGYYTTCHSLSAQVCRRVAKETLAR
jgi:uncharacterized protein (DUF2141 family)